MFGRQAIHLYGLRSKYNTYCTLSSDSTCMVPSKYDSQERCAMPPKFCGGVDFLRPSGKTPAGALSEAPTRPYLCWSFQNLKHTRISVAKIGYFLRHARVSFTKVVGTCAARWLTECANCMVSEGQLHHKIVSVSQYMEDQVTRPHILRRIRGLVSCGVAGTRICLS